MDHIERMITQIIMEMNDDRNDGYTKHSYRQLLEKIQKQIEKALK